MISSERERSSNKDSKVSFRILRGVNHRITSSILGSYRKCLESDQRYDNHNTPASILNFLDQKQKKSTRPTQENQLSNSNKSNLNSSKYMKQIDNAQANNCLNVTHDRRLKFKRKRKRNFTYQQQSFPKEEISIQLQKQDQLIDKINQAQIIVQELHYQMAILQQKLKKITNS